MKNKPSAWNYGSRHKTPLTSLRIGDAPAFPEASPEELRKSPNAAHEKAMADRDTGAVSYAQVVKAMLEDARAVAKRKAQQR